MNRQCRLSEVTKNYLTEFYCILDRMIKDMNKAELSNSISHNFIIQMIPHHRVAIDMSNNILKYTTNIPLQNIATGIITEQTISIENMEKIECFCSEFENTPQDLCLYNQRNAHIMNNMFNNMRTALSTNRINCNFMREMIPHHKGAIEMSENALKYDICPDLVPILNSIITSQKRGIKEMSSLLNCLGCQKN
ncbi:MAG: DUF305 domain-containing protein [Eubacterium sp.]